MAEQEDDLLRVLDVMASNPIDLTACLPHIVDAAISRIEFGFTPELLWPAARPISLKENNDSPLFIREDDVLPEEPLSFPVLAHT